MMKIKHMQLIISAGVITVFTIHTHAAKPSYFIIFNAQSNVFLYLCASRPFGGKNTLSISVDNLTNIN